MGRRSDDEKMVPEKDEEPPSHAPQGQGQAQGLSAEEAMGSRVEDEVLPEKHEDPPSDVPRGQDQENVRRNSCRSVRQKQTELQGHDKERSKKSKFRGIWQKNGKWATEIRYKKRKRQWLGTYDTEEEAALAFDRGAIKYGRSDLQLNFPKPSEEMLEREFKINVKKAHSKRRPGEPRPPIPHPVHPDSPSYSERHAAKPRPAIGRAREADRERKISSSDSLQEELNQFIAPLLMMLTMFVDDLMQNRPRAILIELVKVFIRCISRINHLAHLAHFYKKSQSAPVLLAVNYAKECQHELARALCSITKDRLKKLARKKDLRGACSKKRPVNPDLPSTSTAVVCEEQSSDAESSIETREAFHEGKNLSSSWLRSKLTQILAPLHNMLHVFVDYQTQESADAILNGLVKTFINCISGARSLAQRFDMAQRESGLEAINYARESEHEFAVELGLIMLQQLGELYPSLQPMSQGNSVNRPPVVTHHSFNREHTNDVNIRDRPSTSAEVVANIEGVSSHQNAISAGIEDSGDQGKETAEDGHLGIRVASFTPELVALQEEEHDCKIGAIEALVSLISHSQYFSRRENKSKSED